jgi:hypothetical protein
MKDSADSRWQASWPLGGHLSEESLLELHALRSAGDHRQAARYLSHVKNCHGCRTALADLESALAAVASDVRMAADQLITADRLDRQVNAVARKIDAQPGRVLRFPTPAPVVRSRPPSHRWVAMAAASGLVFGLAAGRLLGPAGTPGTSRLGGWAPPPASTPAATAQPAHPDDEYLLVEVDAALAQSRARAFRVLDDLTPRTVPDERRGTR